MSDITIVKQFENVIKQEEVFKLIDCYKESDIYEEVVEEYEEVKQNVLSLLEPYGVFGVEKTCEERDIEALQGKKECIYVALTIGNKVTQYSNALFKEGDYLKGMLVDAIADAYLFSMEKGMEESIRQVCAKHKRGIEKRLEAPHDIPMTFQKKIWESLQLKERLNIDLSDGYMFNPVKTIGYVLVLSEDEKLFEIQHDCSKCPSINCKNRRIPTVQIEVLNEEGSHKISCKKGENLLEVLRRNKIFPNAICSGKGVCGKCKVRVVSGELPLTEADSKKLMESEINQGYRLACMAQVQQPLTVEVLRADAHFEVLTHYEEENKVALEQSEVDNRIEKDYIIAIDIGTTTLAVGIVEEATGKMTDITSAVNRQRAYGADVISRIQASNEGKGKVLQELIRQDLWQGIEVVIKKGNISKERIKRVVIGCNTTMGHLLMGYSCETLGVFPFTPVNIGTIRGSFKEILGREDLECEVILLPGISTYVGGDIVAGLLACHFETRQEVALFVDLGTNGEMALGNKDKIICAATAAGPAFEGGNILWGTGSIEGAISRVHFKEGTMQYETIGQKPPAGLCGTGVIELVAELVKQELIDETGLLEEDYFEEGYPIATTLDGESIVLTQKDIREIQLAKSAIRTGIEILLESYGVTYDQVETVYLAGGFGFNLDKDKAITIGLFPEAFKNKIKIVGNSSLGGAIYYGTHKEAEENVEHIGKVAEEVNLSTNKNFNEFYMEHMIF
ncbi:ferredoxin [Sporanaerobium hydrogeniformans]|uniref:Ferredoxin n=1 Tax=Sporanaerobium hydrogeniformans TaxID=3072179 RepID=A0AC61DAG5_9FIRM|nr:ASKHA domain-containing protein [Sporanaerobium hydrogeniformans]PHV69666.1 ferredoxin [Sporanaerobium hydrogeniformans]